MDRDYELQTHRAEDRHWWYRGRRKVIERVIDDLRLPARARILDAGCGSGRNMLELARHGTVTGVELSATSVSLARERGAAVLIVTHDMRIQEAADRVIMMEDGIVIRENADSVPNDLPSARDLVLNV